MIRSFRAELARLIRRRVLITTIVVVLASSVGGAAIELGGAKPASEMSPNSMTPTLETFAGAGGGTEVFRAVAAFSGTLVFALFVGLFSLEFSRGTYRTMLFRQPKRTSLLIGRLGALLAFAAAALACGEVATWLAARFVASGYDVSTDAWTGADALGAAVTDYASVLAWVTGYAVLAMLIAVLLRSVPLALAVGIAWAGPAEHLIGDAWDPGRRFFPGLLLETLGQGGTSEVSMARALLTVAAYVVVAAAVAGTVFARRDVTA
ncbi:ABC transporter permease [Streptomyces sp. NPDC059679]|uniref:ABC transporter permease n=1 Tax=Streptomyces sp. NPDC059679 TaxID=3346903 RepID=UPI00368123B2